MPYESNAGHAAALSNDGPPCGGFRAISIDVEEYFQIEAAHAGIPRSDWPHWPSRIERQMDTLFELFARRGVRATMFFLGCVAEQHPQLVRRAVASGHEIASHGYFHDRLHRLTPQQLRDELTRSRRLLEDLAGQQVRGYRAPTWSITRETAWAIDELLAAGYVYDASIFPIKHPAYGVPEAPATPYVLRGSDELLHIADGNAPAQVGVPAVRGSTLLELPPLVWRLRDRNIPVAGGGYFRLLPSIFMHRGLRQAARDNRPAILYFHPWEFDNGLPDMPLSLTGRLRTYTGLATATKRLDRILQQYTGWTTLTDQVDTITNTYHCAAAA